MVGCCGQRGNNQNQRDKRDKCAPINTNTSNNKCMPGANAGINRGKYVTSQHDEEVCHGTGERRRDLLDQLKIFLNEFDDRPCTVTPPQQGPDATRSLGSYSDYLKKHCQSWMPPNPRPPLITSVQTHEVRASSDYDKTKGQTSEYLSFTDATPKPPVLTCDCVKRNGLQDQCPHPMCKPPTAQCKANNPGPCCPPSLGLGGPEAVLGGSKGAGGGRSLGEGQVQGPPARSEYQDAFMKGSPENQHTQMETPLPGFETTHFHDYRDQLQPMAKGHGQASPQPQPKLPTPLHETTYLHDYRDGLQPMAKGHGQASPQPQPEPPSSSYETTYFHDYRDHLQPMSKGQGQSSPQPTTATPFQQQPARYQQQPARHQPATALQHPLGPGMPQPPPGMKMICICKAPSSALPSGKKYLCCPLLQ